MRLIVDIDPEIYQELVDFCITESEILELVSKDLDASQRKASYCAIKAIVSGNITSLNSKQAKRLDSSHKQMLAKLTEAFQKISSEYIDDAEEICETPDKGYKSTLEKIFVYSKVKGSITYKEVNSSSIGRSIRKEGGSVSKADVETIFEYLANEQFGTFDGKFFTAHKNKSLPKNLGKANPEDLPEIALLEM